MTVEVQDPFNTYNAAPGATVFPYEFKIVSPADLIATIDDIVIDLGIDFSLSGVGSNDGGDLTLFAPLVGGEVVLLKRKMTFNRLTDYQQNGDFNAVIVNNDFDRIWLALQQLGQDLLRSIKVPFTETTDQTISLSPAARANKALVFDASGNVTASADDYNDQAADAAASALAAQNALTSVNAVAVEVSEDAAAAAASAIAAATFNPALYARKDIAQAIAEIFTFAKSPLVPTATNSGQAVNKGQLDAFVIPDYITENGLILSTAGASATMTVSAGSAASSDNAVMMKLATAISKTQAAWAVGNGNGGKLSAAAMAINTMYYFHEIIRTDTGVVDVGFDVSSGAPTLPANFTNSRFIGAWPTDASGNWLPMTQVGNDFYPKTPISDINGVACSTTAALVVMSVPKGRKVKLFFNATIGSTPGNTSSYLSDPDNADIAPGLGAVPVPHVQSGTSAPGEVWTDTLGRIRHRESFAVTTLSVSTLGWHCPR